MVASLKALTRAVLAWVEAPATVKQRARNAGIPTPDLAGKEEDRTGVLVIFGSIGTPQKKFGKGKRHYLAIGERCVKYRRDGENYKEGGTVQNEPTNNLEINFMWSEINQRKRSAPRSAPKRREIAHNE
jgi:hypothetical protein